MKQRDLLLISNSTQYGFGFLDYCAGEIAEFLSGTRRVLFVPFAIHNQAGYYERVRDRLEKIGIAVDRLPDDSSAPARVAEAPALFIGGGNTFRLLNKL